MNYVEFYTALSAKTYDKDTITVTVYKADGDVEYVGEWSSKEDMDNFLLDEFGVACGKLYNTN